MKNRSQRGIVFEAARLICEEGLTDYRAAKQKAAQRLGLGPKAALPKNSEVEAAVLQRQRLFGGRHYSDRLKRLRETAVRAMKLLAPFEPRLVGGTVNGAVGEAHRVQLHVFSDKAEQLDAFLHDRGIAYELDEREFRYPDGSCERIPLLRFEAADVGVEVASFAPGQQRRAPVSPASGEPMRRLTLTEAEALLLENSGALLS